MEIAGALTARKFLSFALEQLSGRNPPQETGASRSPETFVRPTGRAAATAVLREIVARYDVTRISPEEFSEMIGNLYKAGALTEEQFQELSLIRVDLDLDRVDPEEPLNLVDFYLDKLRALPRSPDSPQNRCSALSPHRMPARAAIEDRLQWLEKFAAIQSAPGHVGLDALV